MVENSTVQATILGIIQGISEFLPVSSSGHLIIASWLMSGKPLPLAVNTSLHFGTLLAVLVYFRRDWISIARKTSEKLIYKQSTFEADVLLPALMLGSVPAGLIGILWKDFIEDVFHHPLSVAIPLLIVGFLLWWIDRRFPSARNLRSFRLRDGLYIGLAQACALIPGVSRSGATISAGRLLGFDREGAAKFSFLLGTPAMGGAALLHLRDFIQIWHQPDFIAGVLSSFIVGCFAISFFLRFIKRFGFLPFALYRAIVAAVIVFLLL